MLALRLPWNRVTAFAHCGDSYWVMQHRREPGLYKRVLCTCNDRWCQPCQAARAARIRANLAKHLDDTPKRLVTLTVRHRGEPLKVLVDRLVRGYRKLRQRPLWRERVSGAAALLEVKISSNSDDWHPHLHVLTEGRYMQLEQLRAEWLVVTGDSNGADIRLIHDRSGVMHYVTKYVTKTLPPEVVQEPDRLDEAIETLKSRRLLITSGNWRKWRLLADDKEAEWDLYAHENELRYKAGLDDPLCQAILAMWDHADATTGEMLIDLEQLPEPDW